MTRVIAIDNDEDRDMVKELWRGLLTAESSAAGWLIDESGLLTVIDRLDRALSAYDRKAEREAAREEARSRRTRGTRKRNADWLGR